MKTTNKNTEMRDRKAMLSLLWIFVMFNFTYADILTLYFNITLQKEAMTQLLSGHVGSVHITQGFVLLGAVLLETSIAMVLLSRVLKYRANRWANIIVGLIQIAAVVQEWSIKFVVEVVSNLRPRKILGEGSKHGLSTLTFGRTFSQITTW